MCGRFFVEPDITDERLAAIIAAANRKAGGRPAAQGEVRPGDPAAVVCLNRRRDIDAFAMRWGYRLSDGRLIFNARSETAAEKPMFREGMAARRCLIPMSAYFEWEKRGGEKIRYRIAPERNGLWCLAGIYRFEDGQPVCCVLTQPPEPGIAFIHDRMPVIVEWQDRGDYLLGGALPAAPAMRAVTA